MSKLFEHSDGVLNVTLHQSDEDEVTGTLHQPTRNMILERNQELRNNPGTLRDFTFGSHVACIPLEDLFALKQKYPGLRSRDAKIRSKTMIDILRSPEGRKFLVRDKRQGRL